MLTLNIEIERIAYFFVYHGSRDNRSEASALDLSRSVAQILAQNYPSKSKKGSLLKATDFCGVGALELSDAPLCKQIASFCHHVECYGFSTVLIIPLFLAAGTHVLEDIPREVFEARKSVGNSMKLVHVPCIGSFPQMANYLSKTLSGLFPNFAQSERIIINHGSKKPQGNRHVETIARHLDARIAYWSITPTLDDELEHLIHLESKPIVIQPYFLFSGKITDAVCQTVANYQHHFPKLQINLGCPIGEQETFASFLADVVTSYSVASGTVLV